MKSNVEFSSSFSNGAGQPALYSLFLAVLLTHWPWIASTPLPNAKNLQEIFIDVRVLPSRTQHNMSQ